MSYVKRAEELSAAIEAINNRVSIFELGKYIRSGKFTNDLKSEYSHKAGAEIKSPSKHPGVKRYVDFTFLDWKAETVRVSVEDKYVDVNKSDGEINQFLNGFVKNSSRIFKKYEKSICKELDTLFWNCGVTSNKGEIKRYSDIVSSTIVPDEIHIMSGTKDPESLHLEIFFTLYDMDEYSVNDTSYFAFTNGNVFAGCFDVNMGQYAENSIW